MQIGISNSLPNFREILSNLEIFFALRAIQQDLIFDFNAAAPFSICAGMGVVKK